MRISQHIANEDMSIAPHCSILARHGAKRHHVWRMQKDILTKGGMSDIRPPCHWQASSNKSGKRKCNRFGAGSLAYAKNGEAAVAGFQAVPNIQLRVQADLGLSTKDLVVLLNVLMHLWVPEQLPFPAQRSRGG